MQTPEQIAEQLVSDWDDKIPQMAWDWRGFAAEAARRAMASVAHASEPVTRVTDADRLNWLLCHSDAEFHKEGSGFAVVFWHGASDSPSGKPGRHIALGASRQDCIDSALEGRVEYNDFA